MELDELGPVCTEVEQAFVYHSCVLDPSADFVYPAVHVFLLKHVYSSSLGYKGMNKGTATFLTFLLSSCVHELVMAIVTKKIR